MTHLEQFQAEVERFLLETGMPARRLGMAAVGDPNFVGDLRRGREPRLSTISKVRVFMAARRAPAEQSEAAA